MAQFPRYPQQGMVSPQAPPAGVRVNPLAFAGAGAGFGEAIQKVADSFASLAEKTQVQQDAVSATRTLAQARIDMTAKLRDMQAGAQPGAPGFQGQFDQTFRDYSASALEGVPASVRPIVQQRLEALRGDLSAQAGNFEWQAGLKKQMTDLQGTLDLQANAVRTDDSQFKAALEEGQAAIDASGLGDAYKAQVSKTWRAQMAQSMLQGLNERAPDRAKLILDSGAADAYLTPQAKNVLVNDNQVELRRLQAEQDRLDRESQAKLQADVKSKLTDEIASIRDTGKSLGLVTPATIQQAFPEQAGKILDALNAEKAFYDARTRVALNSPAQDAALLERYAPKGAGYAEQVQRRDVLVKAIQAKHNLIAQDPAAYAISASPTLRAAFNIASQDPTQLPAALAQLDQTQAQLGVPAYARGAMPASQAKDIVGKITFAPPEEAANMIQGLAANYGRYWPAAFRDLVGAKLPPGYQVLAAIDDPSARVAFAQALKTGAKTYRDQLGPDAKGIADGVRDGMADFRHTLDAAPNGGALADSWQKSAELLAMRYAAGGMDPGMASTRALTDLVLGKYDILQGSNLNARAPKGLGAAAEAYAGDVLGHLQADAPKPPTGAAVYTVGKPDGLMTAGNIDLYHRPILKNADGSISTVRSITIERDGKFVLLPTVGPKGEDWTPDQAVAAYRKSGQNLGTFGSNDAAEAYAEALHRQQAAFYLPSVIATPAARPGETLTEPQRREAYLASIKSGGQWVTNESDNGWVLLDPARNPVLRADGSRVEFHFGDLPKGAAAPAVDPLGAGAPAPGSLPW